MTALLQELAGHPFYELAIILLLAALLGGVGQWLKQPLIVMFIALGVLVGQSVLDEETEPVGRYCLRSWTQGNNT